MKSFWILVKKEGPEQDYAMNHFVNRNQCCKQKFGKIQHQMSLEKFVKFWTIWLIFDCLLQEQHFCIKGIDRLNIGHFWSFHPLESTLNLKSSNIRASKIIWNDIKLEAINWKTRLENTLFCVCGGVYVGEQISIPEFNLDIEAGKLKEFQLLENIMTSIFCMRIFY